MLLRLLEMLIKKVINDKPTTFGFFARDARVKITVKNNVITLYTNNNLSMEAFLSLKPIYQCDNTSSTPSFYHYGKRDHHFHDFWHQDFRETTNTHWHLYKDEFTVIQPTDINCISSRILDFHRAHDLCQNDENHCALNKKEVESLKKAYEKFYQKNIHLLNQESVYDRFNQLALSGCRAMICSFLSTFSQHYFKPLLIEKLHDPKKASMMADGIVTALMIGAINLDSSLPVAVVRATLTKVLTSLFEYACTLLKIDSTFTQFLQNDIACMFALAHNPAQLTDLSVSFPLAVLGQLAAGYFISKLPKLRTDPEIAIQPEQQATVIQSNRTSLSRRR